MIQAFQDFIEKHELCHKNEKILLAVSGGLDSMVMLHLFDALHYSIVVGHCNFKLRGKDSEEDETFVAEQASHMGIPFYSESFDTESYAREHGASIQMAARDLRYRYFDRLGEQTRCQKLATAHHADDAVETLLLNLIKGTGIAGLRGILPIQGSLIRPLLFATKEQLLEFAKEEGIHWREDFSNASSKYQRNLIRHEIIPVMKKINPEYQKAIQVTMRHLARVELAYQDWIEQAKAEYVRVGEGQIIVDLAGLNHDPYGRVVLGEILHHHRFNALQIEQMIDQLGVAQTGRRFQSATHEALVNRNQLMIYPLPKTEMDVFRLEQDAPSLTTRQFEIRKEHYTADQYNLNKASNVAALDADKLEFPLQIRPWQEGDWFIPLGMQGKKKVSDFMIDQKIPLNLKSTIPIVLSGENIVWVAGYRVDDRYKITPRTQKICELKLTFP